MPFIFDERLSHVHHVNARASSRQRTIEHDSTFSVVVYLSACLLADTRESRTTFNFLGVPARLIFHVMKIGRSTRAGKAAVVENGLKRDLIDSVDCVNLYVCMCGKSKDFKRLQGFQEMNTT